jgi:hypothetical protein
VQDAGLHAVLGSRRSSASLDCWSTSPTVTARSENTSMRSWILSVKGIQVELTSVEQIQSRAWCKPDGGLGMAWRADQCL